MEVDPWGWASLDYLRSKRVSIRSSRRAGARKGSLRKASSSAEKTEPPVGFEPTTARLRIESSTTELRWRPPNLAACCSTRYSTASAHEAAPPAERLKPEPRAVGRGTLRLPVRAAPSGPDRCRTGALCHGFTPTLE